MIFWGLQNMSSLAKSRQIARNFKLGWTNAKRLNISHSFDSPFPQFALFKASCQEMKEPVMDRMELFQLLHSDVGIAGNLKQMLNLIFSSAEKAYRHLKLLNCLSHLML